MSFIDQQQAKKVTEWCEKHPKEADAYFKKHSELSQLFISHKISYDEFKKQSDALKDEYGFLQSKQTEKS